MSARRLISYGCIFLLNLLGSTSKVLHLVCPDTEIHGCFERVNQLLSLLVPVSDINRAAVGGWRRIAPITCANCLSSSQFGNEPK